MSISAVDSNNILVSVIVPVYNTRDFLPRCIESLIALKHVNTEIILVDDGSRDGSGEICDKYALRDARIRVIHKENGGVSSARNAGIDAAKGEYILFCDADDSVQPEFVSGLLECAINNRAQIAFCGFNKIGNGKTDKVSEIPQTVIISDEIYEKLIMPMCVWGYKNSCSIYGSVWRGIYKTDFIRKNNLRFDSGLKLGEDLLFNLNAIVASDRVGSVDKPLYNYFENPTSAVHSGKNGLFERYNLLWSSVHGLLANKGANENMLKWHNYQLSRYATSAIVEGIVASSNSDDEKLSGIRAVAGNPQLKQALSALPRGLGIKRRMQCLLLRPAFSKITLKYYHGKQNG